MAIKVGRYEEAYPDREPRQNSQRAPSFGYAAVDYYIACTFLRQSHELVGPLFCLMLPSMHQTIELLLKAIVLTQDQTVQPEKLGHRTVNLLETYRAQVTYFSELLADQKSRDLIAALENSYLIIRYGEGVQTYDQDAWNLFVEIVERLFDMINDLTLLAYLPRHYSRPK